MQAPSDDHEHANDKCTPQDGDCDDAGAPSHGGAPHGLGHGWTWLLFGF